ncbi:NADP-specific glutamate dehydrogenase [Klebsiella pneumoniae]|nr:NADP-specific glutamate dehydrogenase [Klebsiella pneumoniae]
MDQTCTLEGFLTRVQQRDPHQTEFAQAVREVMTTLWPFLEENPRYRQLALLERLVEPERVIQFRVVWVDDRNQVQVNRAWRVQFNSAIGPYKGGMCGEVIVFAWMDCHRENSEKPYGTRLKAGQAVFARLVGK